MYSVKNENCVKCKREIEDCECCVECNKPPYLCKCDDIIEESIQPKKKRNRIITKGILVFSSKWKKTTEN